MIDEGYVKYRSEWRPGPPPGEAAVQLLDRWRRSLYAAGLIGHYPELDVGFGNLSIRGSQAGQFIISGTQTGHHAVTTGEHYALVTSVDIGGNRVASTGPVQASSEAMTHAAIYALSERINAVVHVHSRELWMRYMDELPTTSASVPYGTPEMAAEFARLWRDSDLPAIGIAIMAGHEEGIVSFGATLAEASERALGLRAD